MLQYLKRDCKIVPPFFQGGLALKDFLKDTASDKLRVGGSNFNSRSNIPKKTLYFLHELLFEILSTPFTQINTDKIYD